MHNYDRPKLIGRFFKKDDRMNRVVTVQDFSFIEICESDLIYPDNPDGNIIHHSLHDQDTIKRVVKDPLEIAGDFKHENAPGVIKPVDFTSEWKAMKRKTRRKGSRFDEDEEYELELEMMERGNRGSSDGRVDEESSPAIQRSIEKIDLENQKAEIPSAKAAVSPGFKIVRESREIAPMLHDKAETETAAPGQTEGTEFVPMKTSNQSPEGGNAEREAIETYRQQIVNKQAIIEREKAVIEEAKSRAFEIGYKEGEEKGAIQAQKNYAAAVQTLEALVHGLQGLKKEVLETAQENFLTICQSMIEALLEREFTLNPASFAHVISRAIKEAVPDDKFRVIVHPSQLHELRNILPPEISKTMAASEQVKQHSFKIESDLTVVDGNITNVVRDLLAQADLQIIDSKTKVS